MVRVLLIQQLFNLSDEQMEFQLLDRLTFQRFVGLRAGSQIPDRTTIWSFKVRLIQAGASESVFEPLIASWPGTARLHCAWRPDDRREHRAGAQAVAEQGRESHR
jgi:IS5 family transposase